MIRLLLLALISAPCLFATDAPLMKHFLSDLGGTTNLDRTITERIQSGKGTPLIRGRRILFLAAAKDGKPPRLLGDFNMWGFKNAATRDQDQTVGAMTQIKATNWYYSEMEVEPASRIEYQFTYGENSDADVDPHNRKAKTTWSRQVSQAIMPGYNPPQEIHGVSPAKRGKLIKATITSDAMGEDRQIQIYLPAGYDSNPDTRYPSIYFGDGNAYADEVKAPQIMDHIIASGRMRPVIGVFAHPNNRYEEYRMNDAYQKFLAHELRNFVDSRYRTITERDARLVIGGSRGGMAATYAAMTNPEIFGLAAPVAPALAPTPILDTLAKKDALDIKWYVVAGIYDPRWLPDARALHDLLTERDADLTYHEFPEGHNFQAWQSYLDDILAAFFPPI